MAEDASAVAATPEVAPADVPVDAPDADRTSVGVTKKKAVAIDNVPSDAVCVRLLLVSGMRTDLLFTPETSVQDVMNTIAGDWPDDWTGEKPESPANLRILLRGKFLEPGEKLASKFPLGQTTTCHLLVKNTASPAALSPTVEGPKTSGDDAQRGVVVGGEAGSSCRCTIL
ncbi:Ubiquitin-like protein 3 [Entophlyctis sp. JEL0112]|nr:Ubiquitin-like protein 3 [Entophlyctis sp. JEL0112]